MTIDECVKRYCSNTNVVLTEKEVKETVKLLLSGETLTDTANKLNIKVCNVYNVRNVFETKCGLIFPNAKRTNKKYSEKLCKVKLINEEDIAELIESNQVVTNSKLKQYIAETLNMPYDKAGKLYRKYMNEYCRFKGGFEESEGNEIKLENYIVNSRHSRKTIMEVLRRVNAGDKRRTIAEDLGLNKTELQSIIYRLGELDYITIKRKVKSTKYEGVKFNA